MKKYLLFLCALTLLIGCVAGIRYPKTAEGIMQKAEEIQDPFKGTTWVNFATIRPMQMPDYKKVTGYSAWDVPQGYFYVRALKKQSDIPQLVQIYFSTDFSNKWGFYRSAVDSEKNQLKFAPLNKEVTITENTITGGAVNTVEDFTIDLDWEYLKARRNKNIIIKVYGDKKDFVFFLPDYYIDGMLKYFGE